VDNLNFDKTIRVNDSGLAEVAFGNSLTNGFPGLTVADRESALRRGEFQSFEPELYVGSLTTPEANLNSDGQWLRFGETVYCYMAFRFLGAVTGTGLFSFKLPFPGYVGQNTNAGFPLDGWAHAFDLSTSTPASFGVRANQTTSLGSTILCAGASSYMNNTTPWTWAVNDTIGITCSYRCVSTR
jgi:hypothetical protein